MTRLMKPDNTTIRILRRLLEILPDLRGAAGETWPALEAELDVLIRQLGNAADAEQGPLLDDFIKRGRNWEKPEVRSIFRGILGSSLDRFESRRGGHFGQCDPDSLLAAAAAGEAVRDLAAGWNHHLCGRGLESVSIQGAEELRRTPHLSVSPGAPLSPGTEFAVEVFADDAPPDRGEESESIVISGSAGEYDLEVFLAFAPELELVGERMQMIRLRRHQARSSSAHYHVRVRAGVLPGKQAALTASFWYLGKPCGHVTRSVLLGAQGHAAGAATAVLTAPLRGALRIEADLGPQADLTILVQSDQSVPDQFHVTVRTPWLEEFKHGVSQPWNLGRAAGEFVGEKMALFTSEKFQDVQRMDKLVGAGKEFFRAAPKHFRQAFWSLVRRHLPLRTIYIVSDEPHIPWELMVPVSGLAEKDERHWKPLGVDYTIGRWVHQDLCSPPAAVVVSHALVLAPNYEGSEQSVLVEAAAESERVCRLFGGAVFTPARYRELRSRIEGEIAPLFHFVGHGQVLQHASDQVLSLEANELLSASDADAIPGFHKGFTRVRPLVFLNACEVGRTIPSLVGASGFPRILAELGASAVIAPLWSVRDSCAHKVAAAVYDAACTDARSGKERPLAEILRDIRARAYAGEDQGEDSFAAYCFYGDPSFVLRLPPPEATS